MKCEHGYEQGQRIHVAFVPKSHDGEPIWRMEGDAKEEDVCGLITGCAILEGGTSSGKTSVMLRAKLKNGTEVFIETTAKLFVKMAGAVIAAQINYGDDPMESMTLMAPGNNEIN